LDYAAEQEADRAATIAGDEAARSDG